MIWIIIFLIIPIPSLVLMYIPSSPKICNSTMRFPNGTEINTTGPCPLSAPLISYSPNLIVLIISSTDSLIYNILEEPLMIIIFLIISYLFSCLIVWIYDKFRKRK